MLRKENAPGPKAEGVVCLHSRADTDAYSTPCAARKPILSVRVPEHERLMKEMPSDLLDSDVARRACRVAWSWRNAWSIRRAGLRIDGDRRITKADADAKLRALLREQMIGRAGDV